MELEGDSPAPRPLSAPVSTASQSLHVTPENVVALAAMFRGCGDLLSKDVAHLRNDLQLPGPWMHDPVSEWARRRFDEYFVHAEHSFVHIVQSEFEQHKMFRDTLVAIGQLYGLTEELISAGFTEIGSGQ